MKHFKRITIIISTLIIFLLAAAPASAAEDMMENLLPSETDKKQEGKVHLEYNEHNLFKYGMDTNLETEKVSDLMPWGWDEGVAKQVDQGLSIVNSALWNFNKITYFVIGTLVSEAFELDFINSFSGQAAKAIQSIAGFGPGGFKSNGLWPYMITTFICIMAIWAGYVGVIKRATSSALQGILTTVLIAAVAFWFFANADKVLTGVNDGTTEVQNDMLSIGMSATSSESYSEKEGIASMRNQIFNLMIKYPWLLLQFGTMDEDKIESEWNKSGSRIDTLLKTDFYSMDRKEAIKYEVEELENNNMSPEALPHRLVILILVLLLNIVMGAVLTLLSGSLILYQILALVFACFTPMAFLMALIPAFSATAKKILMKLVHAFYMKLALSFIAVIYFTISALVYKAMEAKEGYIFVFLIQIVVAIAIWVKRNEIINVVTTPFYKYGVNSNLGLNIQEYKKSYFKGKGYLNKVTAPIRKPMTQSLSDRTGYNKLKVNPGVGVVNPANYAAAAPVERNKPKAAASPAPSAKTAVPAKQNVRNEAPAAAPVERKQPDPPAPNLNDNRNLESLESTLEKGGWAHNTKENVAFKSKPVLKDRLSERQAVTQNTAPQPQHRDRTPNQNK